MVRNVKYLSSLFDGDILFILPPVPLGVPSAYSRSMDGMDKMCDGHLGVPPKPQISKTTLDCLFNDLLVHVIFNVRMIIAITCIAMEVCVIAPSGQVQLISHLLWMMLPLLDLLLSVRYTDYHLCTLLCVMLASFRGGHGQI